MRHKPDVSILELHRKTVGGHIGSVLMRKNVRRKRVVVTGSFESGDRKKMGVARRERRATVESLLQGGDGCSCGLSSRGGVVIGSSICTEAAAVIAVDRTLYRKASVEREREREQSGISL